MKHRSQQPPYLTHQDTLFQILSANQLQPHLEEGSWNALGATCKTFTAVLPHQRPDWLSETYRNAELLSRQIEKDASKSEGVTKRLLALQNPKQCGVPAYKQFEQCRDLIWQSDAFLGRNKAAHRTANLTAPIRRGCNALIYAAKFDKTLQEGLRAADHARERDYEAMLELLFKDVQAVSMMLSCFASGGMLVSCGVGAIGVSRQAWAVGTAGSKTASVLLGGAGGLSIVGGGAFALAGVFIGACHLEDTHEGRLRHLSRQPGLDKIFCELTTGRRLAGPGNRSGCP